MYIGGIDLRLRRYGGGRTPSVLDGFFTSFWKMGDLKDSIGSNDLTNSSPNPVTFSPGKIGDAGNFVTSEHRELTRNNVAFIGPSFTVTAWFKTSTATTQYLFSWNGNNAGNFNLVLGTFVAGQVSAYVRFGGTSHVDYPGRFDDGAYHLAVAYRDSSAGKLTLIVDNGTPAVLSEAFDVSNTTSTLRLGGYALLESSWFNGSLDAVGIADNKVPSAAQITALWNGGNGVEPPAFI